MEYVHTCPAGARFPVIKTFLEADGRRMNRQREHCQPDAMTNQPLVWNVLEKSLPEEGREERCF